IVEIEDGRPVRGLVLGGGAMQRSDRGLEVVRGQRRTARGALQRGEAGADQVTIPARAVLHLQLNQCAVVVRAAGKAGGVKAEEREQRVRGGPVAGRMVAQQYGEVNGLETEVLPHRRLRIAAVIALAEEQI